MRAVLWHNSSQRWQRAFFFIRDLLIPTAAGIEINKMFPRRLIIRNPAKFLPLMCVPQTSHWYRLSKKKKKNVPTSAKSLRTCRKSASGWKPSSLRRALTIWLSSHLQKRLVFLLSVSSAEGRAPLQLLPRFSQGPPKVPAKLHKQRIKTFYSSLLSPIHFMHGTRI